MEATARLGDKGPATLTRHERAELEGLVESSTVPARYALRARIVLAVAAGASNREVAARTGTSLPTVAHWRRRYAGEGLAGLRDRPRSGRPRALETRAPGLSDDVRPDTGDASLERLLEAAARTISRRGFAATRVSDIAAEAGVSSATVHYHFRVKEEILVRALLWAHERLINQLERAISKIDDPVARLAMLIERTIPYPGIQSDEYLLEIDLWSQVRSHPELLPLWERYEERWIGHVTSMIAAGISSGAFETEAEAGDLAERLVAMTDGLSAQTAIGSARMPPERVRGLVLRFTAEQLGLPVERLEKAARVPGLSGSSRP